MSNNDINKYYKILGLKPGASLLEIKRAYRNLVKTQHPDLFDRDPQQKRAAEEKFRKITEAYIKLKKFDRLQSPNQTTTSFSTRTTTTPGTPEQNTTSRTRTTSSSSIPNQTTSSSGARTTTTPRTPDRNTTSHRRNSILSSRYLRVILPIAIGANVIFLIHLGLNNSNQDNSRPQTDSSLHSPLPLPSFSPQPSFPPTPQPQTASIPPPQCRVVAPTIGDSARLFAQASRDADTGKKIPKDTKVSFINGLREFVEVKLADGTSGWMFNDQIYPCKVSSDSAAQIVSISKQSQQSLIIAPTAGKGARIFSQPSRNADIGIRIPKNTKVTSLRSQQEFVEIKLPDGNTGWVFNDQVQPLTTLSDSTQTASMPSQQCRVVAPTIGDSARVFTQPSRDADVGKKIPKDTKVSFINGLREFVEIELPDRSRGWVFNDQIYPCTIPSDSRSQIASVSEQPQQSLIIAPTAGKGARIFSQPSRNADLGIRIPKNTKVTSLRSQQEFVEIQLPDGNTGWVFNDQVQPLTVP